MPGDGLAAVQTEDGQGCWWGLEFFRAIVGEVVGQRAALADGDGAGAGEGGGEFGRVAGDENFSGLFRIVIPAKAGISFGGQIVA